jgi:hypothetical protein
MDILKTNKGVMKMSMQPEEIDRAIAFLPDSERDRLGATIATGESDGEQHEREVARLREARESAASTRETIDVFALSGVPWREATPLRGREHAASLEDAQAHRRLREAGVPVSDPADGAIGTVEGVAEIVARIERGASDASGLPLRASAGGRAPTGAQLGSMVEFASDAEAATTAAAHESLGDQAGALQVREAHREARAKGSR